MDTPLHRSVRMSLVESFDLMKKSLSAIAKPIVERTSTQREREESWRTGWQTMVRRFGVDPAVPSTSTFAAKG